MKLLLDTHIVLWSFDENPTLRRSTLKAITTPDNQVFVSFVTIWEICIKQALGKLDAPLDLEEAVELCGFSLLGISLVHVLAVRDLPLHHRDPFDRMLIAQARIEKLTLVTRDPRILKYEVDTLEA